METSRSATDPRRPRTYDLTIMAADSASSEFADATVAATAASAACTSTVVWSSLTLVALLCSFKSSARWMSDSRFFAMRTASARLSSIGPAAAGTAIASMSPDMTGITAHRLRVHRLINYIMSEL